MPSLTINGLTITVAPGTSLLQASEALGIEIPRFCYHDRLSVAGNCRMCLVEVEKAPKPVASCTMPCSDGMVVHTDSPTVQAARHNVLELLLINHPLDCPICDQGGECDLQDQTMAYGLDRGRYAEAKRAVTEKELGPLIKTAMTRCIHCTRCVRFADEIAGMPEMGAFGRSEHVEIGPVLDRAVTSELSGNMIDICPVGALTNKPYAFAARPWELQATETVDVMDAVGCAIRVDSRAGVVMRVLPRLNEQVNEEWIGDVTRFACDGLKRQRLDHPWLRREGRLQPATWDEALSALAERLRTADPGRIAALAGDMCDLESMVALKDLWESLGSPHQDARQDGAEFDATHRAGYLFNTTIAGLEQADAVLLVGCDPRHEATLINARLRKRWRQGGVKIGLIGPAVDLTYPYLHLGDGLQALQDVHEGHSPFADVLRTAKNPVVILGAGVLTRQDGATLHHLVCAMADSFGLVREGWNGFNVLHHAASRVGALDIGFLPGAGGLTTRGILAAASAGQMDVVYLLGADEVDMRQLGSAFVVYQGHHGDAGAARADLILPGAAYTEKEGLYVNTEGRVQAGRRAVSPPGQAREDWAIIQALAQILGKALPYDSLESLRGSIAGRWPHLAVRDAISPAPWPGATATVDLKNIHADTAFVMPVTRESYYQSNSISRASPTMAACVAARGGSDVAKAQAA